MLLAYSSSRCRTFTLKSEEERSEVEKIEEELGGGDKGGVERRGDASVYRSHKWLKTQRCSTAPHSRTFSTSRETDSTPLYLLTPSAHHAIFPDFDNFISCSRIVTPSFN